MSVKDAAHNTMKRLKSLSFARKRKVMEKEESKNVVLDTMIARQSQEVQVAMLSAKKFPRDEKQSLDRIVSSCQRLSLAKVGNYTYPRGGQKVSGPSIRLAEMLARCWGNIEHGVIELSNQNGKSEMMAYAWDLETNTRSAKTFSVAHRRDTRKGSINLTDSRDIYETTANFASRRMRACILSIIPADIVDIAVDECAKTLSSGDNRSVDEIVSGLLSAFKEVNVTQNQLEKYCGKQLTTLRKNELIDLRGVFTSIKDGQSKVEDYFKSDIDEVDENKLNQAIKNLSDCKSVDELRVAFSGLGTLMSNAKVVEVKNRIKEELSAGY